MTAMEMRHVHTATQVQFVLTCTQGTSCLDLTLAGC